MAANDVYEKSAYEICYRLQASLSSGAAQVVNVELHITQVYLPIFTHLHVFLLYMGMVLYKISIS